MPEGLLKESLMGEKKQSLPSRADGATESIVSEFPRPCVTVAPVIFTIICISSIASVTSCRILESALPGGFVRVGRLPDEQEVDIDDGPVRQLAEATGLSERAVFLGSSTCLVGHIAIQGLVSFSWLTTCSCAQTSRCSFRRRRRGERGLSTRLGNVGNGARI